MSGITGNTIALHRDDQMIATFLCKTQQTQMAGMKDVKMAGHKNGF